VLRNLCAKRVYFGMAAQHGQALVEYGLLLGLIALVAVTGLTAVSSETNGIYNTIETAADYLIKYL